jgi:hypothetical protein
MYITATKAFLPPFVPILLASVCVPRAGYVAYGWGFPSIRSNAYIPVHCAVSLN